MEGAHDEEPNWMSIGLAAALILNKLRNKQRIEDDRRSHEEGRRGNDNKEEEARADLARVDDKRLPLLGGRVRPRTAKGGNAGG